MNVSVVVPVKNEEHHIMDLLDSLARQSKQADEIIIVDGGSTDKTINLIANYQKCSNMPIKLIKTPRALPGRGRNVGIEAASHDLIALTDGGIILDKNWLMSLAAYFKEDPSLDVVYGSYDCFAKTLFEKCFAIVYMGSYKKEINGRRAAYPSIASSMLRRYVWEKAGRFREDLRAAEDILFMQRIEQLKFKTRVRYDAIVHWRPHSTLNEVFRLSIKYSECSSLVNIYVPRYARKILMYMIGVLLMFIGIKHPILIAGALFLFIVNTVRTCQKNWADFLRVTRKHPCAIFIIMEIIITLDVGQIIGFTKNIFNTFLRRFVSKCELPRQ